MGVGNYVHRLLGTMIRLCGDELLWKVHKKYINPLDFLHTIHVKRLRAAASP